MKEVIETERGLTLKELRLQWFSQGGQYMTLNKHAEAQQTFQNIIDTIPREMIAYKEAIKAQEGLERLYEDNTNQIRDSVSSNSLAKHDSIETIFKLEHGVFQMLQTELWGICLRHDLLPKG